MITDINSYVSTSADFNASWSAANAELGAGNAIILAGDYTQTQFATDRTGLVAAIDDTRTAQQMERQTFDALLQEKNALLTRGQQFRGAVLSKVTDPMLLKDLVAAPTISMEAGSFAEPLKAMARLWQRANAVLATEIELAGGYSWQNFTVDIAALSTANDAARGAAESASNAKGTRENVMKAIYERMLQYRRAAPAYLPKNSPVLASLPRLSPPPGTTPPALVVNGEWNGATLMADLTWLAATGANILKLQVRGCTDGVYRADSEQVVADLAADATGWSGDWALTVAGSTASFKVYVVTTNGNENGGKAVKIVRPVV